MNREPVPTAAQLVEYLDGHGLAIEAAFWMLDPEAEIWHLYLASPVVAKAGPRRAYELALEGINQTEVEIPLAQIKVVAPGNPLVRSLRSAISAPGLSWVTLRNNTVNGTYIKDAVILRT